VADDSCLTTQLVVLLYPILAISRRSNLNRQHSLTRPAPAVNRQCRNPARVLEGRTRGCERHNASRRHYEQACFTTAFDLVLSLYNIPFDAKAVRDLRESLADGGH